MFKRVLLLAVLVAFLVVPSAAYDYIETIEHFAYGDALGTSTGYHSDNSGFITSSCFYIWNAENCQYMRMIRSHAPLGNKINVPVEPQSFPVEFRRGAGLGVPGTTVIGKGTYGTFRSDGIGYVWVTFDEWNISAYTGSLRVDLVKTGGTGSFARFKSHTWDEGSSYFEWNDLYHRVNWKDYEGFRGYPAWTTEVYYTEPFKNVYTVDEEDGIYSFALDRTHDGKSYLSYLYLDIGGTVLSPGTTAYSTDVFFSSPGAPVVVGVKPSVGDNWFNKTYYLHLPVVQPCTINVYDAETRLPLAGSWDYYVVVQGADAVSGSGSGAFEVVNLPETSILKPHLLYVTKEGYEQSLPLAFDVPIGGREINVYLTPLETTAPEGSSVVTFIVTDIETGTPRNQCLVNVDGVAKYAGASGTVWFVLPENTTHQWVVTADGYWPIGGNFTLGVDDLAIPVAMTKKTSDLPRPPLPELPNFPVIHPSLDPAGFRMQILSVPLLGSLASPLLDTVDSLGVGLNGMATAVLDVLTAPADYITGAVSSVGQNLIDTATPYLVTSSLLLQVIGAVISCIPEQVCGLVTFGLLLDIARILLWGPA